MLHSDYVTLRLCHIQTMSHSDYVDYVTLRLSHSGYVTLIKSMSAALSVGLELRTVYTSLQCAQGLQKVNRVLYAKHQALLPIKGTLNKSHCIVILTYIGEISRDFAVSVHYTNISTMVEENFGRV